VPFKSALSHADDVDIIVTATGASQYIVKAWDVRNLMMRRNTRPLVAIDIAVPCDIEPEVGDIRNVTLYNLDDLQEIVANNIRLRKEEAERAEVIVQEEIDSIEDRFKYLSTRPVMVSLSDKAEAISLTLPLTDKPYHDTVLFPFFDGLIPEGWLLNIAENSWKINQRDRMSLLLVCCKDCIGAVSVILDEPV